MDKREAMRRARWGAANALIGDIENGWEIGELTDDFSDEQTEMIRDALYGIAAQLRRRLPRGYVPAPFREPSTRSD